MTPKRLAFLLSAVALAVLFALAVWTDAQREWVRYQRQFAKTLEASERGKVSLGLQQVVVEPLGRVDRCTTCHVVMTEPALALAEQPFTAHPGDYLTHHPVDRFACTTCHGGQGWGTTAADAHGEVKHWEQPLLRGVAIQASCYACHGDVTTIAAPALERGQALFAEHGCVACHVLDGFGNPLSVELDEIGRKPLQELDFTTVQGGHTLLAWLYEHFLDPQAVTPGFPHADPPVLPSAMPNYEFSDDDAMALTTYMLGLTGESVPESYVASARPDLPPIVASVREGDEAALIEAGAMVYQRYGCVGCHGVGGRGGRVNWNALMSQEVPSLVYVSQAYTADELLDKIRHGVPVVARLNTDHPAPPLYMPAWEGKIAPDELQALVAYLMHLAPQDEWTWRASDGTGAPDAGRAVEPSEAPQPPSGTPATAS